MKIAAIDNENNLMFTLVRHLRDVGLQADLLLVPGTASHFHPSCDTYDLGYCAYTKSISWGDSRHFARVDPAVVRHDLEPYDVLVGCGSAPAFLARAGRQLDLFVAYGFDIGMMPMRRGPFRAEALHQLLTFPIAQRAGIRAARHVVAPALPYVERAMKSIGAHGKWSRTAPPMLHTQTYNPSRFANSPPPSYWREELAAFRRDRDLLLFAHARLSWGHGRVDDKGNDVAIRGLARAQQRAPKKRLGIVLFEYGENVVETHQLVRTLGLEASVFWLPLCPRREVMCLLAMADLACGDFTHGWLVNGVIAEAMALGIPLLHRRKDADYASDYPDLYPHLPVTSADDVTQHILAHLEAPEAHREIGKLAKRWFESHFVKKPVERIVHALSHAGADEHASPG